MCTQDDAAKSYNDADGDDESSAQRRQLQQVPANQLLPDPNAGYAKAARLIFSNIFDFFRANGEGVAH